MEVIVDLIKLISITGRSGEDFFLESHVKPHGGRKGERTNPMMVQRPA